MSSQRDSKSPKQQSSHQRKSSEKHEHKPKREHKKHIGKKDKCSDKPSEKKQDKPCEKPVEKKQDKPCEKPVEKKQDKPCEKKEERLHFIDRFVFISSVSKIMVPLGATIMKIFMLGGGGGGGTYVNACENLRGGGGGGGSGSYVNDRYSVQGGKFFDVKIGAGGRGGNDSCKNGQDGCNSTLTYDCQNPKIAEGGKGGLLNLNGGKGGKGGQGSSCGESGHNGHEGKLNGRGGAGGRAPEHKCQHYGNGGAGGSNPCLPPECPSSPKHHKECDDEDTCIVGPNGHDGHDGYCEVRFYSEEDRRHEYHNQHPQHIESRDSCAVYWANPDTSLVTIDTSDYEAHLNLGKPVADTHRVTFRLQHQQGLAAYITTFTGGTFVLDSANAEVTLLFNDCVWDVSSNFQGIHSFFPTVQDGPAHCLENFTPSGCGFTTSVDISADGKTLAVGASTDCKDTGATYVYVLQDGCWKIQAKLVGTVGVGVQKQGISVALSADGNTLAVGGNQDNSGIGAVWIFVRNECKWSQQGPKLVSTTPGDAGQGTSVDLSADGNTLAVGAPYTSPSGKFFVYTRTGCVWSQVAAVVNTTNLIPLVSPTLPAGLQGIAVSLSANASLLAVGACDAVFVYTLVDGVPQPNPFILQPPVLGYDYGKKLDLSADGRTLAVGQFGFDSGKGQVFVYVNNNGVWVQQGLTLQGMPAVNGGAQGFAVALTADGNTLAVGSPYDCSGEGAVWIFTRSGGVWTQREKLVAPPFGCSIEQGASLALSSEGTRLVVGNDVPGGTRPLFWVWK